MNKYWWYFLESTKRINNGNVKRPGSKPESLHSLQFPFLQWRWYITIGYSSISCSRNLSKSQPIIWEMETWPCFSYKALLTPERTSIYEKHLSAPLPIQHSHQFVVMAFHFSGIRLALLWLPHILMLRKCYKEEPKIDRLYSAAAVPFKKTTSTETLHCFPEPQQIRCIISDLF